MPDLKFGLWPTFVASLILAMMLRIMPLPHHWFLLNPDWIALCLIYWTIAIPDRFGLGTAWITGLLADALTGRLLGQHAIAYSVIAYLCLRWYRRLRLYPLPQQSLWVFLLLIIGQLLVLWTQHLRNSNAEPWIYWLPAVTGALLWPLVMVTLRQLRRHYQIY